MQDASLHMTSAVIEGSPALLSMWMPSPPPCCAAPGVLVTGPLCSLGSSEPIAYVLLWVLQEKACEKARKKAAKRDQQLAAAKEAADKEAVQQAVVAKAAEAAAAAREAAREAAAKAAAVKVAAAKVSLICKQLCFLPSVCT